MRFLSNFLLFAAYVLIYSAVAAGGKFATEPWAALFADAYAAPPNAPLGQSIFGQPSGINTAIGNVEKNMTAAGLIVRPVRPRTPAFTG